MKSCLAAAFALAIGASATAAVAQPGPPMAHLCEPGFAIDSAFFSGFYQINIVSGLTVNQDGEPQPQPMPITIPAMAFSAGTEEIVFSVPGMTDHTISLFAYDGLGWIYAESVPPAMGGGSPLTEAGLTALTGCHPMDMTYVLYGERTIRNGDLTSTLMVRMLPGITGTLYGHVRIFSDGNGQHYNGFYYVEAVPAGF